MRSSQFYQFLYSARMHFSGPTAGLQRHRTGDAPRAPPAAPPLRPSCAHRPGLGAAPIGAPHKPSRPAPQAPATCRATAGLACPPTCLALSPASAWPPPAQPALPAPGKPPPPPDRTSPPIPARHLRRPRPRRANPQQPPPAVRHPRPITPRQPCRQPSRRPRSCPRCRASPPQLIPPASSPRRCPAWAWVGTRPPRLSCNPRVLAAASRPRRRPRLQRPACPPPARQPPALPAPPVRRPSPGGKRRKRGGKGVRNRFGTAGSSLGRRSWPGNLGFFLCSRTASG